MNVASRMESTGAKSKIQVSKETAELLIAAGKEHWLQERQDRVFCKGKGELQTVSKVQYCSHNIELLFSLTQ